MKIFVKPLAISKKKTVKVSFLLFIYLINHSAWDKWQSIQYKVKIKSSPSFSEVHLQNSMTYNKVINSEIKLIEKKLMKFFFAILLSFSPLICGFNVSTTSYVYHLIFEIRHNLSHTDDNSNIIIICSNRPAKLWMTTTAAAFFPFKKNSERIHLLQLYSVKSLNQSNLHYEPATETWQWKQIITKKKKKKTEDSENQKLQ